MLKSWKKILLCFFSFVFVLFGNSNVLAQTEVGTSHPVDEILDVFSEDYDREITNYTDSVVTNRIIAELDEYFGWDLSEENIEDGSTVKVKIPDFTEEDGNELRITVENHTEANLRSYVDLELARKWDSKDEYKEFYTVFCKILDTDLDAEEIENSFTDFLDGNEDYEFGKIEFFITDVEIYEDGKEWVSGARYFDDTVPFEDSEEVEASSSTASTFNPDDYPYITDYESVVRDPNGKAGENINIYGTVVQVMEDSGITALRVATTGGYDDIYLVYMSTPDVRIIEDDVVDVYGLSMGLETYQAVLGNSITVPSILAVEVWVQGIDF